MRVLILGATGKTGVPLVQQALAGGHTVTAFVRNPASLTVQHPNLHVVQGDIQDAAAVAAAVAGQDAVLSALGPVKGSPENLMVTAARNVVAAMQQHNVRRLIWLTGAGVIDPKDPPSFAARVIVPLMKLIAGAVLRDSEAGVRLIQASGLEWTVVRGPRLGTDPKQGGYRHGYITTTFKPLSREDLAEFMLAQLSSAQYVRESPIISY